LLQRLESAEQDKYSGRAQVGEDADDPGQHDCAWHVAGNAEEASIHDLGQAQTKETGDVPAQEGDR
jgi:hypothetical protein